MRSIAARSAWSGTSATRVLQIRGEEREDPLGQVVRGGQGNLVEAVEIDDDVEVRAEGEQIAEGQQLLGLLVAAQGDANDGDALAAQLRRRTQPLDQIGQAVHREVEGERASEDS